MADHTRRGQLAVLRHLVDRDSDREHGDLQPVEERSAIDVRSLELLAESTDPTVVDLLTAKVQEDDLDDHTRGVALRSLARAVSLHRPLALEQRAAAAEALDELAPDLRFRHRYVLETLTRFLDEEVSAPGVLVAFPGIEPPVDWTELLEQQASPRADERMDALTRAVTLAGCPVDILRNALTDPVAEIRLAATELIDGSAPDELFELVAAVMLDDPSHAVRLGAARPLALAPAALRVDVAAHAASSRDQAVRACAVSLLTDGTPEQVKLLDAALHDAAPEVVAVAASVLARSQTGRSSLAESVREALTDTSVEHRLEALSVLYDHPNLVEVETVIDRLRDPVPAVRIEALRVLQHLDDDELLPHLLAAAGDPADAVRAVAHNALAARRSDHLVAELLAALVDPATAATSRDLLISLGPAAVDEVVAALDTADSELRVEIGLILASGAGLDALVDRLTARDPELRLWALDSLLAARATSAVEVIVERLADPVVVVRARAIDVLGELGDPRVLPALRQALISDPDADLMPAIEAAIGRLT